MQSFQCSTYSSFRTTGPTMPPCTGSVIRAWKPWRSLGLSDRGIRKILTRPTHVCPIWATLNLDSVTKENGVSYQVSVLYFRSSRHEIKGYSLASKWRWLYKAWICCDRNDVLVFELTLWTYHFCYSNLNGVTAAVWCAWWKWALMWWFTGANPCDMSCMDM